MLVKELYYDSLRYEAIHLAYSLYHLLQTGKIQLDEDAAVIDFQSVDEKQVAQLIEENPLGFRPIKIYSLKMAKNLFVFIFAASRMEAIHYYQIKFQRLPLNCHEYPLDIEVISGNKIVSFQELKKEFDSFPAIAGWAEGV